MPDVDYEQPYITAAMDQIGKSKEPPNKDMFHPYPGILRLAILLIELHFWKPIEIFREEKHLIDGSPTVNTDLLAATDLVKTSLSCCFDTYRGAIEACVDVPWVSAGTVVDLEDNDTWNGVFNDIISPLRQELERGETAARSYSTRRQHVT